MMTLSETDTGYMYLISLTHRNQMDGTHYRWQVSTITRKRRRQTGRRRSFRRYLMMPERNMSELMVQRKDLMLPLHLAGMRTEIRIMSMVR